MIAEDGRVKIVDFRLAKLTETAIRMDDRTRPAAAQTEDGAILGTISYMSPEQAEGKKVDARSDIFSFGTILCEMLAGRKPFDRDSGLGTLAAILSEEPKPLEGQPAQVERLIRRCLCKEPAKRFQSMAGPTSRTGGETPFWRAFRCISLPRRCAIAEFAFRRDLRTSHRQGPHHVFPSGRDGEHLGCPDAIRSASVGRC